MNPVVAVHFVAALVAIVISVPLIRRRVKMNDWYGIRIPAAFESEEVWYDINQYGGRLFLGWGVLMAVMAIAGAFLPKSAWLAYNCTALAIIFGGLATVVTKIFRYARSRSKGCTERERHRPS